VQQGAGKRRNPAYVIAGSSAVRQNPLAMMVACVLFHLLSLLAILHAAAALSNVIARGKEALLKSRWLDFKINEAAHARDVAQSVQIGYKRSGSMPTIDVSAKGFSVPRCATGMGPVCPFAAAAKDLPLTEPLELVFESDVPIASIAECDSVVDEAKAYIASGGSGSGFTLADTNRNIAVADLPHTLKWLNEEAFPRIAVMATSCFGEDAIGPPEKLLLYRALVVQYDALAGLTHQEVHRDGSLVTCVLTLSDRDEYKGGGTFIEPLDQSFAPPKGHALLAASALRHAGHHITAGHRWVIVLFIISEKMKYGEHMRYLKRRAQMAADDGDIAQERQLLELARVLCDDDDHELLYDMAVGEAERGNTNEAVKLYEKSIQINSKDKRAAKNLAALLAKS